MSPREAGQNNTAAVKRSFTASDRGSGSHPRELDPERRDKAVIADGKGPSPVDDVQRLLRLVVGEAFVFVKIHLQGFERRGQILRSRRQRTQIVLLPENHVVRKADA